METLEDMVKRHECIGGRPNLRMYKDTMGIETIGYGHNLRAKPIPKEAAEVIFTADLEEVKNQCLHAFPWYSELTERRKWVIVDMCFNLGLGGLLGFKKFLKHMSLGEYALAAVEMMDSDWAVQVGYRALELRAILLEPEAV